MLCRGRQLCRLTRRGSGFSDGPIIDAPEKSSADITAYIDTPWAREKAWERWDKKCSSRRSGRLTILLSSERKMNYGHARPRWLMRLSQADMLLIHNAEYEVQVRYRSKPSKAWALHSGNSFSISLSEPIRAVAPGQSAVIYDGEMVVGGGVIQAAE